MKIAYILLLYILFPLQGIAQNDVTQFLGIPIDGTKSEMIYKLKSKGFTPNIKKSKLGYIIRSHILKNTEIFMKTKNNGKLEVDHINLVNTTCNIRGLIKGCWFNDNSYGLYITLNSVEIVKM